jgi:hypothetical protein
MPNGKIYEIEIDGIKALAQRDKDAPTFCQWSIVEKQTGCSLLPSSWPGGLSANTLNNAIYIVKSEVIDKMGRGKINERIKEILFQKEGE